MQKKKRKEKEAILLMHPTVRNNWIFKLSIRSKNISKDCVTYTNISKIHKLYNEFISTVSLDMTNFNKPGSASPRGCSGSLESHLPVFLVLPTSPHSKITSCLRPGTAEP